MAGPGPKDYKVGSILEERDLPRYLGYKNREYKQIQQCTIIRNRELATVYKGAGPQILQPAPKTCQMTANGQFHDVCDFLDLPLVGPRPRFDWTPRESSIIYVLKNGRDLPRFSRSPVVPPLDLADGKLDPLEPGTYELKVSKEENKCVSSAWFTVGARLPQ